jgi:hypothetical protein
MKNNVNITNVSDDLLIALTVAMGTLKNNPNFCLETLQQYHDLLSNLREQLCQIYNQ